MLYLRDLLLWTYLITTIYIYIDLLYIWPIDDMHVAFWDWNILELPGLHSLCHIRFFSRIQGTMTCDLSTVWLTLGCRLRISRSAARFCLNSPCIWGCCWEIGFACECRTLTSLSWWFQQRASSSCHHSACFLSRGQKWSHTLWQSRNSLNLAMSNNMSDKPKRKDAFTVRSTSASFMYILQSCPQVASVSGRKAIALRTSWHPLVKFQVRVE